MNSPGARTLLGLVVSVLWLAGAFAAVHLSRSDGGASPAPAVTVSGTATALHLAPARLGPVALPLAFEAAERGAGRAVISPVTVDGERQTISWGGGTPLRLLAAADPPGSLNLEPVELEASPEGLAMTLAEASGRLSPGAYRVEGPVAVGAEGLARPVDGVGFEVLPETTVTFGGAVLLRLPPAPRTLEGPGTVVASGDLTVVGAEGDPRRLTGLVFGPGPYRINLVFEEGRLSVDAVLEGEVRPPRG